MGAWSFLIIYLCLVIIGNITLAFWFKKSQTLENKVLFQTSVFLLFLAALLIAPTAFGVFFTDESYEDTIGLGIALLLGVIALFSLFVLGIMGLIEGKGQPKNLLTFTSIMCLTSLIFPFFLFAIGLMPIVILLWKLYKYSRKNCLLNEKN